MSLIVSSSIIDALRHFVFFVGYYGDAAVPGAFGRVVSIVFVFLRCFTCVLTISKVVVNAVTVGSHLVSM